MVVFDDCEIVFVFYFYDFFCYYFVDVDVVEGYVEDVWIFDLNVIGDCWNVFVFGFLNGWYDGF